VDDIHAVSSDTTVILWDGSGGGYNRGTINEEEALNGNYCFEAQPDGYADPSLRFSGKAWRQNLSASDSIVFYAKATMSGRKFDVKISTWNAVSRQVDVLDYIEGGTLDTDYKRVVIPISDLKVPFYALNSIEYISFPVDTTDFQFFIDDIHVVSCGSDDDGDCCLVDVEEPNTINFSVFPNPILSVSKLKSI